MTRSFTTGNAANGVAVIGHGADLMDALLTPALARTRVYTCERGLELAVKELAASDAAKPLEWLTDRERAFFAGLYPDLRTLTVAKIDRWRLALEKARARLARVEGREYVPVGSIGATTTPTE